MIISEAFSRKEFYLLWVTRLSVVMLSNVISAFYKVFGQTFIRDDKFLSVVGSINSVFNCSGRLLYGLIMDKFAYKVSMSIEAVLLVLLMSTFYLTSMIGVADPVCQELATNMTNLTTSLPSTTTASELCAEIPTSFTTKVRLPLLSRRIIQCSQAVYAVWVWAIYLTFPGTYSTQVRRDFHLHCLQ